MIRSGNTITDQMLAEQHRMLADQIDRLAATANAIKAERDSMREALREVRDILEDYADVTDGGPLGPNPNHAMRAMQIIDAAFGQE